MASASSPPAIIFRSSPEAIPLPGRGPSCRCTQPV